MYSSLVKPLYRGSVGACGRFFCFLRRGAGSIEVLSGRLSDSFLGAWLVSSGPIEVLSGRFSDSFLGAWAVSSGSMGGEVVRYALVYGEM